MREIYYDKSCANKVRALKFTLHLEKKISREIEIVIVWFKKPIFSKLFYRWRKSDLELQRTQIESFECLFVNYHVTDGDLNGKKML